MKNKKLMMLFMVFTSIIVLISFASADEYDYARNLIQSKISCSQLNDSQLEQIGDFYMEQMHPGQLHVVMENRLGGEGSESLRLAHIAMGKSFYCGDSSAMSYGMMNVITGRADNYTYGGMMGGYNRFNPSSQYSNGFNGWNITSILIDLILVLFIIALIVFIVRYSKRK